MSDSSRVQIERYLTSMWEDIRTDISSDRKVTPNKLNEIADSAKIHRAEDALKYKMLDGLKYRDEVISIISKKVGIGEDEDLHLQAFEKEWQG